MSELTIHTGAQGAHTGINIDWFDENNVRHTERIAIMIEEHDKPRTLVIGVNGDVVLRKKYTHYEKPQEEVPERPEPCLGEETR